MHGKSRKRQRQTRATRKQRTRKHRGGSEIESKIMQTIKDVQQDQNPRSFQLNFTFKGLHYSTTFTIKYIKSFTGRQYIEMTNNECILIDIECDNEDRCELSSYIMRNSSHRRCFVPQLKTIDSPVKITSVDVLQTLTTKIKIILFNNKYIADIHLIDNAEIDDTILLPYRILRGVPAIYEKYGYICEELNEFRINVLPKATWEYIISLDTKKLLNNKNSIEIFESYNKDKFKDDWKIHHISELLVNIPFEEEINQQFSSNIMYILCGTPIIDSNMTRFVLDPLSTKWKEWSVALEFVGFEEILS